MKQTHQADHPFQAQRTLCAAALLVLALILLCVPGRPAFASPVSPTTSEPTPTDGGQGGGLIGITEYPFKVVPSRSATPLAAGCTANLSLEIANVHNEELKLEEVLLETNTSFPFVINQTRIAGSFDQRSIPGLDMSSGLNANNTTISFPTLQVRQDVPDGYQSLTVIIYYSRTADTGSGLSSEKTLYEQHLSWNVAFQAAPGEKEDQRILIDPAQLPALSGTYGQTVNLQFGIVNRGFDTADIISVSPVISTDKSKWPFEISQSDYTLSVARPLYPIGEGRTPSQTDSTMIVCDFGALRLLDEIPSGVIQLDFKVKYKFASKPIEEAIVSTFINIEGNPNVDWKNSPDYGKEWPSSLPRLMVTGFTTDPSEIMGGQTFTLHLKLKNTSQLSAVNNIRITLSSTDTDFGMPFLPASGANSLYIDSIAPEEDYSLDIKMESSVKVPQKSYPLKIQMEYEDWKVTAIQAEENISIQIKQPFRVDIGKIEVMPPSLSIGQEANVLFPIYNKGKTKLFNVSVTVPEGQGISGNEAYIGNIEAGATGQVDMMLSAMEAFDPMEPRKLKLNYEDEIGKVYSQDLEVELSVMDDMGGMDMPPDGMFPGDMDGGEMEEERTGFFSLLPLWAWILIASAVLLLVIALLVSALRKKKKKQRMKDDEAYFRDLMR